MSWQEQFLSPKHDRNQVGVLLAKINALEAVGESIRGNNGVAAVVLRTERRLLDFFLGESVHLADGQAHYNGYEIRTVDHLPIESRPGYIWEHDYTPVTVFRALAERIDQSLHLYKHQIDWALFSYSVLSQFAQYPTDSRIDYCMDFRDGFIIDSEVGEHVSPDIAIVASKDTGVSQMIRTRKFVGTTEIKVWPFRLDVVVGDVQLLERVHPDHFTPENIPIQTKYRTE